VVVNANATVKKSRLGIIAAAVVVLGLVAFSVVYFATRDSDDDYQPGPVAQAMLDSMAEEGVAPQLSGSQLRCVDDAGKGIDPAMISGGALDTLDLEQDPEMAAFVGAVYDDCFDRDTRIDLFAAGMVADGSGTAEAAQCAATALDDAVLKAGGYTEMFSGSGEALMSLVFGMIGTMAECGIEMMGD